MAPTTINFPQETEATLEQLAQTTGKTRQEIIQDAVKQYLDNFNIPKKPLPQSIGKGASGRSDLSTKANDLLWQEK